MADLFPLLFSPLTVGPLTLKNRVVMAPIDTNLADSRGRVTDELLAFYARRAQGGTALITVENTQVEYPRGKNTLRQLSADHDDALEGLARLARAIREKGAAACLQLHHAGRETTLEVTGGIMPVAPSPLPCGHLKTPVRELSAPEIEELIDRFAAAAGRAWTAGFDMVEIHGAHGYLVGEFLSPYTNRRSDEYGGDFQGRMRFITRIVAGIRQRCGRSFTISVRFSADEFVGGGIDGNEAVAIARHLESIGVDLINVSAGIYESLPTLLEPMSYPQGWRTYLAAEVKKAVAVPVMCVGVIREPSVAEAILQKGDADLIGVGRGLLADPDWTVKAAEGRTGEIRRCIGCNEGCLNKRLTKSIACSVNPETGREKVFTTPRSGRGGSMLVVGGGPSGLQAAVEAAENGFDVTVWEKGEHLGGQLRYAWLPPGKDKIRWLLEYYERRLESLKIRVEKGRVADATTVLVADFPLVVVATGSTPQPPAFPCSGTILLTPEQLLGGGYEGMRRAVVVGAGGIGCETALFLTERGISCRLLEQAGEIAVDVEPITGWDLKDRLARAGVRPEVKMRVVGCDAGVLDVQGEGGTVSMGPFDCVVWAAGRQPLNDLAVQLTQSMANGRVLVIGDAVRVGKIHDAVHSASNAVRECIS